MRRRATPCAQRDRDAARSTEAKRSERRVKAGEFGVSMVFYLGHVLAVDASDWHSERIEHSLSDLAVLPLSARPCLLSMVFI
jgi:hypothetical protein